MEHRALCVEGGLCKTSRDRQARAIVKNSVSFYMVPGIWEETPKEAALTVNILRLFPSVLSVFLSGITHFNVV